MLKPRLYTIPAFSTSEGITISYAWMGDRAYGSRLIVLDNETQEEKYRADMKSFLLSHQILGTNDPIPSGITVFKRELENGRCYSATLYVIGKDGNIISDESNSIIFYCYSTPTFRFTNIPSSGIVENSFFQAQVEYFQSEGERLSEYQINLFDHSYKQMDSSGTQYAGSNTSFEYQFAALLDGSFYYIRATGKTNNGIIVDTGYVELSVKYTNPSLFSHVVLECNEKEGYILVKSNLITAEGQTENPPVFIDGKYLDLRNDKLTFHDIFVFPKDFWIGIIVYGLKPNSNFLILDDGKEEIRLFYRERYSAKTKTLNGFFELESTFGIKKSCATYNSTPFSPISESDRMRLYVYYKDSLPTFYIKNLGPVTT